MSETLSEPTANPSISDPSTSGSSTALLDREVVEQPVEPGDHERFAHYVRKDKVMESAMTGEPVIALCGKVWVPGRDPKKFPVCPMCKEVFDGLRPGDPRSGGTGSGGSGSGGSGSGGPGSPE